MTDRELLLSRATEMNWFHAIDFGDCQSPGRFPKGEPQNRTLFGVMDMLNQVDLTGLNCLDVGTADGLIAFNMATRGAARVVATDFPPNGRPSFHTARELLNLDVELVPDTTFENIIDKLGEHVFDVVVCAGVMYHMLNPFDCILKSRRLLKRNGLFLFQTLYDPNDTQASLYFNPVARKIDHINVFWVPSKSAVTGMLALGGFQQLAVRTGTLDNFIATIASNENLKDITDAPELISEQHKRGMGRYSEFRRDLPEKGSPAKYRGPHSDEVIDALEYKPNFPPHPTKAKRVIGSPYDTPSKIDLVAFFRQKLKRALNLSRFFKR